MFFKEQERVFGFAWINLLMELFRIEGEGLTLGNDKCIDEVDVVQ
jgi:hypothetical protein